MYFVFSYFILFIFCFIRIFSYWILKIIWFWGGKKFAGSASLLFWKVGYNIKKRICYILY